MILSDLPSPAEASTGAPEHCPGFAQAGNRFPPSDQSPRASFFGIMRAFRQTLRHSGTQGGDGRAFDQIKESGAGEGIRTLDPNLGKVVLYP
jgi:hypothetical protein